MVKVATDLKTHFLPQIRLETRARPDKFQLCITGVLRAIAKTKTYGDSAASPLARVQRDSVDIFWLRPLVHAFPNYCHMMSMDSSKNIYYTI